MHQCSVDVRARSPALRRALTMRQMSVDEAVDQSVADIVKGSMLLYCEFSAYRSHFVFGVMAPPDFRRKGATAFSA
jgi:hypothetical protein